MTAFILNKQKFSSKFPLCDPALIAHRIQQEWMDYVGFTSGGKEVDINGSPSLFKLLVYLVNIHIVNYSVAPL